jgi:hypothetical protein
MADETPLPLLFVQHHGRDAVTTDGGPRTGLTAQNRRPSPPIKKDQYMATCRQGGCDRLPAGLTQPIDRGVLQCIDQSHAGAFCAGGLRW